MLTKAELKEWVDALPDKAHVAISEGGKKLIELGLGNRPTLNEIKVGKAEPRW